MRTRLRWQRTCRIRTRGRVIFSHCCKARRSSLRSATMLRKGEAAKNCRHRWVTQSRRPHDCGWKSIEDGTRARMPRDRSAQGLERQICAAQLPFVSPSSAFGPRPRLLSKSSAFLAPNPHSHLVFIFCVAPWADRQSCVGKASCAQLCKPCPGASLSSSSPFLPAGFGQALPYCESVTWPGSIGVPITMLMFGLYMPI